MVSDDRPAMTTHTLGLWLIQLPPVLPPKYAEQLIELARLIISTKGRGTC